MDVFERVREVSRGAHLNEEQISGARQTLMAGIEAQRKSLSRRPMLLIAGAVAGVAAVTATVVIVNQPSAPEPRVEAVPAPTIDPRLPGSIVPHPTATSGTGVTEPFPGTTPQGTNYLRVLTTDERLMYSGGEGYAYQWFYRPAGSTVTSAALVRSVEQLFVPADRSGEWIGRTGPSNERIALYPAGSSPDSPATWDAMVPYGADRQQWTFSGGIGGEQLPLTGSADWYAQYPEDPQAVIQYFRDQSSPFSESVEETEEKAVNGIVAALTDNFAPADRRAIFIEALTLTGRAEVVSDSGGIVTYRLRYMHLDGGRTDTVSIDTSTGWATEYTVRFDRAGGVGADPAPTSVPDIRQTFTVTIVDSAD